MKSMRCSVRTRCTHSVTYRDLPGCFREQVMNDAASPRLYRAVLTVQSVPIRRLRSPPCQRTRAGPGAYILRPGEPGEALGFGVLEEAGCGVGGCGSEHPAASSALCVLLSPHRSVLQDGRRGEGKRERREEPAPSSPLWPIAALPHREPPLLAVSVQTMLPSQAVGKIGTLCRFSGET